MVGSWQYTGDVASVADVKDDVGKSSEGTGEGERNGERNGEEQTAVLSAEAKAVLVDMLADDKSGQWSRGQGQQGQVRSVVTGSSEVRNGRVTTSQGWQGQVRSSRVSIHRVMTGQW